ncbi:MAG: peptidoglycan DD-metalloendopeptidase family protein [Bacteroidales bacterium]|nr:peptidoglycan DD-metalloendopeptidase family protein [Bacteroidales bacterium]
MRILLSILFSLSVFTALFSQGNSKLNDLEKKRKAALEQIASINKMLNANQKDASYTLNRLKLLGNQITSRKKLITLLNDELDEMELQINSLEKEINLLEAQLDLKREEYGKSVQLMFMKRSSYDKLMFIFSSNSLSQAYRRTRYLKEYALWSRMKGEEIMIQQAELNKKKQDLEKSKSDKQNLLSMREQERKKLVSEEDKQKGVVKSLGSKRKQLQSSLSKQKKQAKVLDQQIQRIIQEEIRRAQEEARKAQEEEDRKQRLADEDARRRANEAKAATKSSTKPTANKPSTVAPKEQSRVSVSRVRKSETKGGYAMTKEEKSLSDDFSKNRGILPIPLTGRFMIVGHFGQQQHEDLKYVVTNNNGVDIQGEVGADARAIFGGVVSKVFAVPGYNSSVIVRHGNYLSVYSNLSRVYVGAGDRVSTKQALGKIYSDSDQGNQTILHFQIWKETTKQNPEIWINF